MKWLLSSFALVVFVTLASSGAASSPDLAPIQNLDDYSLLQIFDYLDLDALYNVASVDNHFRDLIAKHYLIGVHRWHEQEFSINFAGSINYTTMHYILKGCPMIIAGKYKQAIEMLRNFGGVFTHINVYFQQFGKPQYREIAEYINEYCTKATLNFYLEDEISIGDWDISFKNVEIVALDKLPSVRQFDLLKFFPNMRQLIIEKTVDLPMIGQHFPKLIDFSLRTAYDWSGEQRLHDFIRLNPQLRQFGTTLFKVQSYLEDVNEMLPNLNELTIHNNIMYEMGNSSRARSTNRSGFNDNENSDPFIQSKPTVRFANVTRFAFALGHHLKYSGNILDYVSSIEFDDLQSFTLEATEATKRYPQIIDALIDIIGKYDTVTRVDVSSKQWSYEQLMRLVELMPNMTELGLTIYREADFTDIQRFLTASTRLEKVHISLDESHLGWKFVDLAQTLQAQWKVTYGEDCDASGWLERKKL